MPSAPLVYSGLKNNHFYACGARFPSDALLLLFILFTSPPNARTCFYFPVLKCDVRYFSLALLCVNVFFLPLLRYFVDTLALFWVFPGHTAHGLQRFVEVTMKITFLCPTQLPISWLVLLQTRTTMCRQHPRPVQRRHRLKKDGKLGPKNPEDARCWVRLTSKTQECCGLKHFGGQHKRSKGGRRCRRRCRSKAQTCKRGSPSA